MVFDPATLPLSGWWRASYTGSPWTPTASTGASGTNGNLSGADAPAVGAAVNGLTPADCDGVNDALANGTAITSMVNDSGSSSGTGSMAAFFYADTAFSDTGSTSFYLAPSLVGSATSRLSLSFSTSGVLLGSYNGGGWNSISSACATGGWHFAQARWGGTPTVMEVRVDDGSWTTTTRDIVLSGGSITVGQNYDANFFDGKFLEVMTSLNRLSDSDFDNLYSYTQDTYISSGAIFGDTRLDLYTGTGSGNNTVLSAGASLTADPGTGFSITASTGSQGIAGRFSTTASADLSLSGTGSVAAGGPMIGASTISFSTTVTGVGYVIPLLTLATTVTTKVRLN